MGRDMFIFTFGDDFTCVSVSKLIKLYTLNAPFFFKKLFKKKKTTYHGYQECGTFPVVPHSLTFDIFRLLNFKYSHSSFNYLQNNDF